MTTKESLAVEDPFAWLEEEFGNGVNPHDAPIILKNLRPFQRAHLHQAVRDYADLDSSTVKFNGEESMYIGHRTAVNAAIDAITQRREQWERAAHRQERQQNNEGYQSLVDEWNTSEDNEWDIAGTWEITCPAISYSEMEKSSLTLSIEDGDEGTMEMYAEFDFGTYTGVMRFLKPGSKFESRIPASERAFPGRNRRDWRVCGERSSKSYLIPEQEPPGPERRDWFFRWRGEETGEGHIQRDAEEYLCQLRFKGAAGLKLEGRFRGGDRGEEFEGRKIARAMDGKIAREPRGAAEAAWESKSEAAWEVAERDRWRNRW